MKFGIFSRSTAGYLMVLLLLGGSNIYAILQLAQFNAVILKSHNEEVSRVDMGKRLVDSILSQRRYEQKYLLTADPVLLTQFLAAKSDFERTFAEIRGPANSSAYGDSLGNLEAYYRKYQALVDQELRYLKEQKRYDGSRYKVAKEKAADGMLVELKRLEERSREDLYDNTRMVSEAGDSARRMAVLSFLMTVLLAVLLSFLITRSITRPLIALVKKTREIPTGDFSYALKTSAPPEIVELSEAFTTMGDRLKKLERMRADFFAMISHELKTPLTTIREGSSLLLEGVGGTITERQDRLLTIIAAESKRMTGMVNSILNLSKMEAGMMPYTFEPQAIGPLVDQAVSEIAPYAEAKGIHMARQIHTDASYPMDGERILDVLRNLIGNAVKFTPEGGLVSIAANPFQEGLKVSVSDSGPGIPRERLTAIFEKFESSDQKKGTGLGLAIVKHIAEAHGGKVWVESNPGEGSRFIFVLPS